jgi:hypothetical protein
MRIPGKTLFPGIFYAFWLIAGFPPADETNRRFPIRSSSRIGWMVRVHRRSASIPLLFRASSRVGKIGWFLPPLRPFAPFAK